MGAHATPSLIALSVWPSFHASSRGRGLCVSWRLCTGKQVSDSSEMEPIALFQLLIVDLIFQAAVSSAVTVWWRQLGFTESSQFITTWQTNTIVGRTVPGWLKKNMLSYLLCLNLKSIPSVCLWLLGFYSMNLCFSYSCPIFQMYCPWDIKMQSGYGIVIG